MVARGPCPEDEVRYRELALVTNGPGRVPNESQQLMQSQSRRRAGELSGKATLPDNYNTCPQTPRLGSRRRSAASRVCGQDGSRGAERRFRSIAPIDCGHHVACPNTVAGVTRTKTKRE